MTRLVYERDGAEIYRRSFATIRAETDLGAIPTDLRPVAVRMVHACGMVDLVDDLAFSPDVGVAARAALQAGAPVLADAQMVAHGVTRSRLPAGNAVRCLLDHPDVPTFAAATGTTRSAAAVDLWLPELSGAVVAIGNAPTALFRLLELLSEGAPRPAAILGLPVGFVGAAESKEALAAGDHGVPWLTVHGRRGGSAMAAAAVNALASEREMTDGTSTGRLYGVGVGPGDPELITVKALRILQACPVVASFAAAGRSGNARRIVEGFLKPEQERLLLTYPVTTGAVPAGTSYEALLVAFYDDAARIIAVRLDAGQDVAVVCEGDPLLYGSYMYIHNRLGGRYRAEIVPGIPSVLAGAAVLQTPLVCKEESLSILSGMLPADELEARLRQADAAVVVKLGRNLTKVRDAVARAGLLDRAHYVERASMEEERVLPLAEVDPDGVPYFSMVVIPSATAHAR